jgi:hypothetical protein
MCICHSELSSKLLISRWKHLTLARDYLEHSQIYTETKILYPKTDTFSLKRFLIVGGIQTVRMNTRQRQQRTLTNSHTISKLDINALIVKRN